MQWSQLEDFEPRVRYNALNALGKLEPAALAQHAEAVVARLEDSDWGSAPCGIGDPGQSGAGGARASCPCLAPNT